MATFEERLKQLRREKHVRQEDIAAAVDVSKGTVSVWERGGRKPEFETLDRLCEYFNTTLGYLLGNSDMRYPQEPDERMMAVAASENAEDTLRNLIQMFISLSSRSREIVSAAIMAAYKGDREQGELAAEDAYTIDIKDKWLENERKGVINKHNESS